ncbi:uncharacterized protein LOC142587770 isoform X2 [Dermacentor variabilis]|uniref:uncharacterized protein LOC142587770 isoform X2 n=1 Tax=Dermacentor variabilis TaxID=34621 RepID=UPI003F5B771C
MFTMPKNYVISGFIFVLVAQVLTKFADGDKHDMDIGEFLNTSEIIWTCNSTTTKFRPCKLDEKYNITNNTIVFYRDHLNREKLWKRRILLGTFTKSSFQDKRHESQYDQMDTRTKRGINHSTERVQYQDKNNECAVFAIPNGKHASLTISAGAECVL